MSFSSNCSVLLLALLAACVFCSAEKFSSGLELVLGRPVVEWDYSDGPNGPAHWGELSREWSKCSQGSNQSPVDVDEEYIKLDSNVDTPAKIYYHPAQAFARGDGKTLEVDWAGGIFNCHDYDYSLEKLVFHSPSEHTYFGERFPLEVQFYHTHPEQGVAVNTLVFREGEHNEWLHQFSSGFSQENLGKTISLGLVTSTGVEGEDLDWSRYYRYLGSLTTPPCTQRPSVIWSLLKAPLSASKEQINEISAALLHTPNARPIQATNRRHIYYPRYVDDSA